MIRRLLRIVLSVVSLSLGVTAACVWPRTLRCCDDVAFLGAADVRYSVHTCPGGLCFEWTDHFRRRHDPHDPAPVSDGWSVTSRPWGWSRPYVWVDEPIQRQSLNYPTSFGPVGQEAAVHSYYTTAYWVVETLRWDTPPHRLLGFGWGSSSQSVTVHWLLPGVVATTTQRLVAPLWFVSTALLVPPLFWLVRAIRRRLRLRAGRCARCGYDLRATRSRCPECGTAVAAELNA